MTEEQKIKSEYLSRAFKINNKIKSFNEAKNKLKFASISRYSDSQKHTHNNNNADSRFIRFAELDEKISDEISQLGILLNEIYEKIKSVEDVELSTILTYRYINNNSMKEIAEKMHYDERTIQRKHLKALDAIVI